MAVRKILHVIPSVGHLRGGPSVMLRSLARNLSQAGIETHIATTDDNGPRQLDVPWGVPVLEDGVTYWYFHRQTRFYTFSWPLSKWLAKHIVDFDLVHIHALFSYATLPAAYWAHKRGIPYIIRPLGTLNEWGMKHRRPWLKRLSFALLESRVLKYAAIVHFTSEQERYEASQLGVHGPSEVIPNALPEPFQASVKGRFRALHPELKGKQIILFFSRLDRKKGLELLLAAFAKVRLKTINVALVIAGNAEPDYLACLKSEAAALGVAPDISWTGFLAGERKWEALTDADVFVLPSHSENFGIAVVEAMAAGLPVVVSDQVGIHREVSLAGAGLVVSRDINELAGALLLLLTDSDLRASMGNCGRVMANRDYSPSAVTSRMVSVYAGIVAS